MSGGDKQGCGIILMAICVLAIGGVLGLIKSATEHPGYALLLVVAIVAVYILRKKDQDRVNRNSEESRSSRRPLK